MHRKIRVAVASEKIHFHHENKMWLMARGSRREHKLGNLINDVRPFAYFCSIFLQTGAKTYKQTLEVFAAGWMISVLETKC